MQEYLNSFTMTQLVRLYHRIWQRMTKGDGYQPFGYDARTLWLVHPQWMTILESIKTNVKIRGL